MCAGPGKASYGRFSTGVMLLNEELSFVEEFRYIGHIVTADCWDDKDIKKLFRRKYAGQEVLICTYWGKLQLFKSYCYPIYGCALWHYSFQNSIRKLTVSISNTFKRLINVPRYTSSSLTFAMNVTDNTNVVLRKFAYSLMSSVVASLNSILLVPLLTLDREVHTTMSC